MSRHICLTLAAMFALAWCNLAKSQELQIGNTTVDASPPATNAPAPAADDLASLQAENAALKKQVADAAHTIAVLQAELAKAGVHHRTPAGSATAPQPAADTNAPGASAPAEAVDASAAPAPANAAPTGPLRALPLDSPDTTATAGTPGVPAANAGPSRSYTVVKGDSLWKIAHKMYPHDTLNGEDKIRDANKEVFNGKFLQPGQVLVIPQ